MEYVINRAEQTPSLNGEWNADAWQQAPPLSLEHFHPRSSSHRPRVQARLLYDADRLHGIFHVQDRYVRCIRTDYQSSVCLDSCVEFFVAPRPETGEYFNFEWNCGGTMLLQYGRALPEGPRLALGEEARTQVGIVHSMPKVVEPEIVVPTTWTLQFRIELRLFASRVGELGELSGQCWTGSLYKCADTTSHPAWASWTPLAEELSFHRPECFGKLRFA